jgi:WD40 repeat protein
MSLRTSGGVFMLAMAAATASAQTASRSNILWWAQEADATTFRNAITFSPNGELVATGRTSSNTVALRRASDGLLVRTLTGRDNNAGVMDFSPDSLLLATGAGSSGENLSLNLWSVPDGVRLVGRIPAHHNGTRGTAFSPDGGTLATFGFHETVVKMWPVPQMQNPRVLANFDPALGYNVRVHSIAVSPDGDLLAVGDTSGVKLRRVSDGGLVLQIAETGADITSLEFSPDGQTVAAGVMHQDPTYGTCLDCMVRLWRVSDGALLQTFRPERPDFYFPKIGFSSGGGVIAAGAETGPNGAEQGLIQFWAVGTGQTVFVDRRPSSVHAFAFSPDPTRYGYVQADGVVAVARLP